MSESAGAEGSGSVGQDLDMLAAQVGEGYVYARVKQFCLQSVGGFMGVQFLQCVNRSGFLINNYFNKLCKMQQEMSLQDQVEITRNDPSFFVPPQSK